MATKILSLSLLFYVELAYKIYIYFNCIRLPVRRRKRRLQRKATPTPMTGKGPGTAVIDSPARAGVLLGAILTMEPCS